MQINFALVNNGNIEDLFKKVKETKDIFLANENGMIDTERIDAFQNGKLRPQSIDLENLEGNERVVSFVKYLLNTEKGLYFPGTLLEDRNGLFFSTMPIITNGKIVNKRRKIISIPLVDDWIEVAKFYVSKDYSELISESQRKLEIKTFQEEPYKTVYDKLKEITISESSKTLVSLDYSNHRVLPVICNEISSVPNYYEGKQVDVILNSACNYFDDEKERVMYFAKFARKMIDLGKAENSLFIACAEIGKSACSAIYKINDGCIMRVESI